MYSSDKDNGGRGSKIQINMPEHNKIRNSDAEVWQSICSISLLLWLNGHNTVFCHLLGLYQ